jgi:hypothetical protein
VEEKEKCFTADFGGAGLLSHRANDRLLRNLLLPRRKITNSLVGDPEMVSQE